jgi:tetratricopeptide (TPR) repeat protein
MGDMTHLSTRAAEVAEVAYRRSSYDRAERYVDVSKQHALRDDIGVQIAWRSVRAKILARREDFEEAHALAREAIRLSDRTDTSNQRAQVQLDTAEVLALQGRRKEATACIEQAVRVYERKQNAVSASMAKALLERRVPA